MNNANALLILGAIIIFGIISFNTTEKMKTANENSVAYYTETQVRNICNSAVGMLISNLADNTDLRVEDNTTIAYGDGYISYTIKDKKINGQDRIEIFVAGTYETSKDTIIAYVKPPNSGFIPPAVKGAISTNNPIELKGNMQVDGRNHDLMGNLIANSGTNGIWTTQTFSQDGSSDVGGTSSGSDYNLSSPGNPNIIKTGQTYPGGYPDNPDDILGAENGFTDGKLKQLAQSGINGSQYVTDPSDLDFPLKGITYVELPASNGKKNGAWKAQNIQGTGILIIHNSVMDAKIENLNSGTFSGLIIADDIVHIHTNIVGAVVGLSPAPSEGNCLGNGSGNVFYSSEAITNATSKASENNSTAKNYGYGKYRLQVTDWFEKN